MLPPIVFIHGWKASVLVDRITGEEKFNYRLAQLLGFGDNDFLSLPMEWDKDGNQVKDNLEASKPCHNVKAFCGCATLAELYGPLLEHLKKSRDVHTFTYDWRRSLDETALAFEKFIETVKYTSLGRAPQVIGHSMGCLITLNVFVRRPELFHSVLFGAPAYAPNVSSIEDFSATERMNTMVKNTKLFTPKSHITNPSAFSFVARTGERELFGKEHVDNFYDSEGRPITKDLHQLETWKNLKIGMYHPLSNVEVTPAHEEWMQAVLDKCLKFRKGLIPDPESDYPPVAVIRGDHIDTSFALVQGKDGVVDFDLNTKLRGDGRILLEDAVPPKGIKAVKIVTNEREHSDVLNDLENVDGLLQLLIEKKDQKE